MSDAGKFARFGEYVRSADEIFAVMGPPKPGSAGKVIDHVDDLARAFIARCPYLLIASSGADGHFDVSPKGDPAGFVKVLDDRHIAIPDRLGNRRVDTFRNVLENPKVGLIFLIPGKTETLRISGEARIVRDEDLRASMAVSGRAPDFAMIVYVERLFIHCAKSTMRSHLWDADRWPDAAGAPSLAEANRKYAKLTASLEEVQAAVDQDARERLY